MQVLAADGSEIPVRRRNFDLLVYLIENRHRFVEFEEIRKAVWVNVYISEVSLRGSICELREALGDGDVIATRRGSGYRFAAAVSVEDTQGDYVRRPEQEQTALECLTRRDRPVVLLGYRQSGKSAFVQHLCARLSAEARVVRVDLLGVREQARRQRAPVLQVLAAQLARDPAERDFVARSFADGGDAGIRLTRFLGARLLPGAPERLVLAIDNADALWGGPEEDNQDQEALFAVLRSWVEQSMESQAWSALRLLLAISLHPSILTTTRCSPFYYGSLVKLADLTADQVRSLLALHGCCPSRATLQVLLDELGGVMGLWRRAIDLGIAREAPSPRELPRLLLGELLFLRGALQRESTLRQGRRMTLLQLLHEVFHDPSTPLNPEDYYRLYRLGVLRRDGGNLVLRCRLYRSLFLLEGGLL